MLSVAAQTPHLMTKVPERRLKLVVAKAHRLLSRQWAAAAEAVKVAKACLPVVGMRVWSRGSSACSNRFTSVLSASACKDSRISRASSFRLFLGKKLSSAG